MEETTFLKIGAILQTAIIDEADAIKNYMAQLDEITALSPEIAETLSSVFEEIVADELNHIEKLKIAFQQVTGIVEAVD